MTDLESSGDVFGLYEILEIGLVVFEQKSFKIIDTLNIKVKPEHIEINVPAALAKNGYREREDEWKSAITLAEAIKVYAEKTKDCVFCAYNATFDWGFMNDAFKVTGVKDTMDYHHLDLMSMALMKYGEKLSSLSMNHVSKIAGIPEEPLPHLALNGAMQGYYLYKALMQN